jgi:subtilase family serine protease
MLKAGSSVSLTLSSVQFPMAGGYVVTFAIDPNDEIAESDEHDNVDFVPINVP